MTTADTGAQAPPAAANGHQPPAPAATEECESCATRGEIALAVIGGLAGALIIAMAVDLASGGKLGRKMGLGRGLAESEEPSGDGNSGT